LDSGHPISQLHLELSRESKNPMIFNLLQKRFSGVQPSIPQYITRDIILNKVKSNSDESFKVKINKKGEQILRIKLNPSKKNEEIIAKIRKIISHNTEPRG
jgi:uncharacterized protein (DUF2249 family)